MLLQCKGFKFYGALYFFDSNKLWKVLKIGQVVLKLKVNVDYPREKNPLKLINIEERDESVVVLLTPIFERAAEYERFCCICNNLLFFILFVHVFWSLFFLLLRWVVWVAISWSEMVVKGRYDSTAFFKQKQVLSWLILDFCLDFFWTLILFSNIGL